MARRVVRRSPRRLLYLIATLLATMAMALAAAVVFGPIVQRERYVAMLKSEAAETRLRGMYYLVNHAEEPALHERLASLLGNPETGAATHAAVARAMRKADAWGPSIGRAWVHYLRHRAAVGGANVRQAAAMELARAGLSGEATAGDPLALDLLGKLASDESAEVRYWALTAAGTLAPEEGASLIRRLMDDPAPGVAYRAWLLAGWNRAVELEPPSDAALASMGPGVRQAAAWAFVRRHGAESAGPWLERQWRERPADDPLRVFAPYLMRGDRRFNGTLRSIIEGPGEAGEGAARGEAPGEAGAGLTPADRLARWRAALAISLEAENVGEGGGRALVEVYQRLEDKPGDDLFAAAIASRLARFIGGGVEVGLLLPRGGWSGGPGRFWRELAAIENAPTGALSGLMVRSEMPPLVRAAAARAASEVDAFGWLNAFDAEPAGVRHMAAFAALDRLEPGDADALVRELLASPHRWEALGGAVLAGLTGRQADLLERQGKRTDDWLVALHTKLGRYMIGDEIKLKPETLLVRRDFPPRTVWLAMMHRGERAGFDRFFQPLSVVSAESLRRTLDQERYWHTLRRYLPSDAPPFWLWADAALQRFQVDVMRTWYLTRRGNVFVGGGLSGSR